MVDFSIHTVPWVRTRTSTRTRAGQSAAKYGRGVLNPELIVIVPSKGERLLKKGAMT